MSSSYRIVVGVDGSEGGTRALRWAVHEAGARGGTVHAVTAYTLQDLDGFRMTNPEKQTTVQRMLDTQVTTALEDNLRVQVTAEVAFGEAPDILTRAVRHADLLVLGSHGHGRLFHAVLGSVAESCIRTATAPVVVVPVPRTDKAGTHHTPSGIPSATL